MSIAPDSVVFGSIWSEAPDKQGMVTGGDQPSRKGLRSYFPARFHLVAPCAVGQRGSVHIFGLEGVFIPAIEGALDMSLIGD
jgi:hypothetical protein